MTQISKGLKEGRVFILLLPSGALQWLLRSWLFRSRCPGMTGSSWENIAPVITVINISTVRRAKSCSQHFPHILSLNLYNNLMRSYYFCPHFIDGEIESQAEEVVTCSRSPSKWLCWDLNPAVWQQHGAFSYQTSLLGWRLGAGCGEQAKKVFWSFPLNFDILYFEACIFCVCFFLTKKIISTFPLKCSRAHTLWTSHSKAGPGWLIGHRSIF